jgi:hypothetical protein
VEETLNMMDIQRIEGFAGRESLKVGVLIDLLFGDSVDSLEQQRRAIIFYPDLVTEEENKKNLLYENFSEWVVARIHPNPGNRASLSDVSKEPVNTQDFYSWLCKNKRKLPLPSQAKLFIKTFKKNQIKRNQSLSNRPPHAKGHKPSNARREVSKLNTQARYKSWQKAYRELKKTHPGKSDSWYAQKIAKMDIAQDRNSETIRKNMKI